MVCIPITKTGVCARIICQRHSFGGTQRPENQKLRSKTISNILKIMAAAKIAAIIFVCLPLWWEACFFILSYISAKNKSVKIMLLYKSRREPTSEFPSKPEVLSGPSYFFSLLLTPGSSHRVPMSVYKIISDQSYLSFTAPAACLRRSSSIAA